MSHWVFDKFELNLCIQLQLKEQCKKVSKLKITSKNIENLNKISELSTSTFTYTCSKKNSL